MPVSCFSLVLCLYVPHLPKNNFWKKTCWKRDFIRNLFTKKLLKIIPEKKKHVVNSEKKTCCELDFIENLLRKIPLENIPERKYVVNWISFEMYSGRFHCKLSGTDRGCFGVPDPCSVPKNNNIINNKKGQERGANPRYDGSLLRWFL